MTRSVASRSKWLLAAPVLLGILWISAPLIGGQRTLFLRDVMTLHYPAKLAQAKAWDEGRLPLVDPQRAGGQTLLGNPNSVALHPDNLLFRPTSVLWGLNAHFWLHWLLAPLSMVWLARRLSLRWDAAWAAATVWALSGYFLSQLNLYNLIAGVALTPALCAAALQSLSPDRRQRAVGLVAVALLVALQAVSGDPMIAVQAVALAGSLSLVEAWRRERTSASRRCARTALAGAAGLLLAWPQIAAFFAILGRSFRGSFGFGGELGVQASWDPRLAFEWLLPFAFGQPNLSFWGDAVYGSLPLIYSTFPGVLGLVLVLSSGVPRRPAALWAWAAVALGVALALGRFNPVVLWLAEAPGARLLRFPVKFWLLVAVGASVLAGFGWQSFARAEPGSAPARRPSFAAGLLALVYVVLVALLLQFPDTVRETVARLLPPGFPAERAEEIRLRWVALAGLMALTAGVAALLLRAVPRRRWAAPAVLTLHVVTQLLLLQPLVPTDESSFYRQRPALLDVVDAERSVVQLGPYGHFSGERRAAQYPDRRAFWSARRGYEELEAYAGTAAGLDYELNVSAEGLDSFLTEATLLALRPLVDAERLQVLRALGVGTLILDRRLEGSEGLGGLALARTKESYGRQLFVYTLAGSAPRVALYGDVLVASDLPQALARLTSPDFDPTVSAVITGDYEERLQAPVGELEIVELSADRLVAETRGEGPNLLVWQRSHLPLFRAEIDGEPVPVDVANLSRLALRVPAGEHRVRLEVDRGPFLRSLGVVPLGAVLLLALLWPERALLRQRARRESDGSSQEES